MQSPIERIINNDRKAREIVAEAERYRKEAAEKLAEKKAQIDEEYKAELAGAAKSAKERSEKKSDEIIARCRKDAEEISRRMDELYAEKKSEWIEYYTRRIIDGE